MEIKMMELDRKVFGKITTKEIIGAFPPAVPDTKNLLDNELNQLTNQLELHSKEAPMDKFEIIFPKIRMPCNPSLRSTAVKIDRMKIPVTR